jgi:hypothetical protein
MAEQVPDHTLQTTAVIHEAYLKFAARSEKNWANRAHFFAVAANLTKAMRYILVDHARANHAARRGGEFRIVALEEELNVAGGRTDELMQHHQPSSDVWLCDYRSEGERYQQRGRRL